MKKLLVLVALTLAVSGCASTKAVIPVQPLAPENALKSQYRKVQEVILVSCDSTVSGTSYQQVNAGKAHKLTNTLDTQSVVEATDTGERFVMYGCYGKVGDRFKIAY
ncbi:MAG: hypothetical protein J0665_18045 [Deltaproteobacteria bacterium]|nr:hypothetical protein [Deltaproteobacteria bacterium]